MHAMTGWRGPLQGAYAHFRGFGVKMEGAARWALGDRVYRLGASHGLEAAVGAAAKARQWTRLAVMRSDHEGSKGVGMML